MVVVDANVLLSAVNRSLPHHDRAKSWIEEALAGEEPVGLAWPVLLAFMRAATMPALSPDPLGVDVALELVDEWLSAYAAEVVLPTPRHAEGLRGLLIHSGTGGNLVMEAHLAALAIERDAWVCTFDRDFARFAGIHWFAPPRRSDIGMR